MDFRTMEESFKQMIKFEANKKKDYEIYITLLSKKEARLLK